MAYEYRWSSARGHIERGTEPLLSKDCYLGVRDKRLAGLFGKREDEQLVKDLRKSSMPGRLCSDDEFIQSIEGLLGRRLLALPWDRPSKGK